MRSYLSQSCASAFRSASLALLLLTASALAQGRVAPQQQPTCGSANDNAPRMLTQDDADPAKAPVRDASPGEPAAMGPGVQRSLKVVGSEQPLISFRPFRSNGIYMTGAGALIQAEPIPAHFTDLIKI